MIHEYLNLLHDVPHIMFEMTWDAFVIVVSLIPFKRWIRRHDREKHHA